MDPTTLIARWLSDDLVNPELYAALIAANQVSAFRAGVAVAIEQINKIHAEQRKVS